MKWLVIGISGVTCGGKTTMSRLLHKAVPWAKVICQDTYFFPENSDRHIWVPEVKHSNWEVLSSLDMERMWSDVSKVISSEPAQAREPCVVDWPNLAGQIDHVALDERFCKELRSKFSHVPVLLIEGFIIFNYKRIAELCDLKFFFTLSREECWERRNARTYDPPDPPGYFDAVIWPMYQLHKKEVSRTVSAVKYYDGTNEMQEIMQDILQQVCCALQSRVEFHRH